MSGQHTLDCYAHLMLILLRWMMGRFCDIEMTLIKFDYQGQKFSAD